MCCDDSRFSVCLWARVRILIIEDKIWALGYFGGRDAGGSDLGFSEMSGDKQVPEKTLWEMLICQ